MARSIVMSMVMALALVLALVALGCKDEECPECPTDEGQTDGDDDDSSEPDLCGNAEYDGDEQWATPSKPRARGERASYLGSSPVRISSPAVRSRMVYRHGLAETGDGSPASPRVAADSSAGI
jgi:hypothetical protein